MFGIELAESARVSMTGITFRTDGESRRLPVAHARDNELASEQIAKCD